MHKHGCLFRDLVRIQGKDVLTPVSRILIGDPGCTYKYLNTRLFTVPWPVKGCTINYTEAEIAAACQTFLKLNDYLQVETIQALEELAVKEKANEDAVPLCMAEFPRAGVGPSCDDEVDIKSRAAYNVTLLNFMDPQKMPYLKEEPYFGMGKMAVSWHHDENLVDRSAVAVYSYSCEGTVCCGGKHACWQCDQSHSGSDVCVLGSFPFLACLICMSLSVPLPHLNTLWLIVPPCTEYFCIVSAAVALSSRRPGERQPVAAL